MIDTIVTTEINSMEKLIEKRTFGLSSWRRNNIATTSFSRDVLKEQSVGAYFWQHGKLTKTHSFRLLFLAILPLRS